MYPVMCPTPDRQPLTTAPSARPVRGLLVAVLAGITVALALSAPPAVALEAQRLPSQYLIERFGRDSGLPSDTIWEARPGPRGYLWLATRGGLVRFDGLDFTVFNTETDSAFRSNDVRALAWTPGGTLWIGTYGGGALRLEDGVFTALGVREGLASDTVYDIHIDDDAAVWFATGVGVSRHGEGALRNFDAGDGLFDGRPFKIAAGDDGALWFSSLTDGLARYDGEAFRTLGTDAGLASPQVHLLERDPSLGLLTATVTGNVYRLSEDGALSELTLGGGGLTPEDILRGADGGLWLGTYGQGLWRIGADGERRRFPLLPAATTEHVFDVHQDQSGSVWVSTMNGLFRIRDSDFLPFGRAEGLADSTFVVTGDDAGGVWAGAENAGLFHVAADGRVSQPAPALAGNSVSSLLHRGAGELWVGTFGSGVYRLDGADADRIDQGSGLSGNHVLAIAERADGSVWIASDGGIDVWREGKLAPAAVSATLGGTLVRHIREGSDGSLWLATNDGLVQHGAETTRRWDRDSGLASDVVTTSYEDERGVVWIGTRDGGLARLENGALHTIGRDEGLPQASVLAIVDDGRGRLWLSGTGGLVYADRDSLDAVASGERARIEARRLQENDGLRSAQFMGGFQPAGWLAADGWIWFPTNRGVIALDPDAVTVEATALETYIEAARVNGEPVTLAEPLQLPSGLTSLEIDYTAPQLANAEGVRFRYRLGGAGGSWQNAGERRTAYFTALPAGEQRFEVQAMRGTGAFPSPGDESAGLTVHRAPRWFETVWVLLVGVLALWLVFAGAYRLFDRRARLRELRLERLVDQRTEELQQALAKVEEISRVDGLTGVANRHYLEQRLAATWKLANREKRPLSVIMMDIDRFKQFNDNLGHQAGDDCLRAIAGTLQEGVLRENDLVARYGGEEFVFLLYDADRDGATRAARRIIEQVAALKLRHPESDISPYVTVSLGCATARADELEDPYTLIDRADQALYLAKGAGRNQLKIHDA